MGNGTRPWHSRLDVGGYLYNGTTHERKRMKAFEILTGELVLVYAETEEEAMDKLGEGEYEEIETLSEVQREYEVAE
jgi:hypothetical protein